MTDERRTLEAEPLDRRLEVRRKLLEIHRVDGRPRTIARQVERNRMQACALESRDLRRPSTGRTADPMQEYHARRAAVVGMQPGQ